MAEHPPPEGSSTGNASAESSESTVELNIKTLDSQMHSFCVDKNIPVSAFKEKIAGKIGLPVGQQRLIFRGIVLKDDHLLSEYHVDNGHTLHLVARQPSQLQSSSSDSVGDRTADTANGGLNSSAPGLSTTVGQVSHGVILGLFSTGEQGESPVPDLVQVIGAVLNSLGIGNQNSVNVSGDLQNPTQTSQGSEAERRQPTAGYQSQSGNQSLPRQAFSSQPLRQIMQIPLGAILSSTNELIPDSLHTISEFMTLIETTLIGNQPNQSSDNTGALPSVTLPVDSRGMPTAETLGVILRHAQWLLGDCAIDALSQVADLLEEERDLSDTTIRSLVQAYAMQVGIVMQDLGALLLEIGRTMLALHMGRSPGESYVNSGPAVYISPSGSNPIMVQPSPLQSTSLFGGFVAPSSATGGAGPITRNMNIHMNTAVDPMSTNNEGSGNNVSGMFSGDSGQTRVLPERNIPAATVLSQPSVVSDSSAAQHYDQMDESGARSGNRNNDPESLLGIIGETYLPLHGSASETERKMAEAESYEPINKDDRNLRTDVPSSSYEGDDNQTSEEIKGSIDPVECVPSSKEVIDSPEGATTNPLGLGMGRLQSKRRSQQPTLQGASADCGTSNTDSSDEDERMRSAGQQCLQSFAPFTNQRNANTLTSAQLGFMILAVIVFLYVWIYAGVYGCATL